VDAQGHLVDSEVTSVWGNVRRDLDRICHMISWQTTGPAIIVHRMVEETKNRSLPKWKIYLQKQTFIQDEQKTMKTKNRMSLFKNEKGYITIDGMAINDESVIIKTCFKRIALPLTFAHNILGLQMNFMQKILMHQCLPVCESHEGMLKTRSSDKLFRMTIPKRFLELHSIIHFEF
jgi:hypothetical protein